MPVNGSPQEYVAINDRGLAYGDGVFETIRLHEHRPVLLDAHLERLYTGVERLRIPLDRHQLTDEINTLAAEFPAYGILKIVVTRGPGGRGYLPATDMTATRILSLHAMPEYHGNPENGIAAFVCEQRLSHQPALAGIKHLNRLEQVLASMEWPGDDYMEGLMLDTADSVIEGTRSNLFWAEAGQLYTPSLTQCGVAGIMRNYLIYTLGDVLEAGNCSLARLAEADEVFFCNSIFGVWPVTTLRAGATELAFDPARRTFSARAAEAFSALLANRTT